ncbi:hypothetical protein HRR83_006139 [Exophiala dermatitidis]|uniref:Uncharacterized protein n=2 Tax=Exophiala dermatitidis TaxID=5970 RepID=H6BME1_EXODN|nr:uncharacterized protein HMPREF1120_01223 [Exophiala dermatitidis NIH/UT8656]KAJ4512173.1 hypothetical protein HRR75_005073 [Exophiala dermatitidis]EHY53022.1 hypothetical protein HMPREF1120_01223 [Exophiala dermatitidis NIH/UT8656]KAJ4515071.1 hypothetical protein HRR74_005536 [Exophiala dermatitidis]KAJ4517562.1 hypothetical protein HRR73_004614 [Exophiala dermatitidis]KAJ4548677.1 hypothetical protein HRR76_001266 [Exophiala dermatitidis]
MEIYGMTGEKLGTIGQVDKGKKDANADVDAVQDAHLPQWKRDFLQKPSISTRRGIAWGYSPPYEDTDTIVLTSPKAVFVDIRFPLRPAPTDPVEPLISDPAFWAFSGTASSTFYDREAETQTQTGYQKGSVDFSAAPAPSLSVAMPYTAHAVFRHEIDSKGPGISDEGDMFLLPNGDCVEVGMMHNPRTNRVEMYKEYWTAPPAAQDQGQGQGQVPRTPCVVAKTLDLPGRGAAAEHAGNGKGKGGEIESGAPVGAGVVIRVGDYCQGIVQRGKQTVLVERWQKTQVQGQISNNGGANGGVGRDGDRGDGVAIAAEWTKDRRSNTSNEDISMPCQWLCADTRTLGDQIVIHGVTWSVVEVVA